jgi:voltage-gated potassium channel
VKDFLIKFAYFLKASQNYYKIKHLVFQILEDNNFLAKKYFDFFMIFLVLSTVAILIYEVDHKMLPWLDTYESVAIIIFIVEWLSRLWVSSNSREVIIKDYEKTQLLNQPYDPKKSIIKIINAKLAFIFSPMSIIDLLAILPYYRPLRILRILMLFRLFKILRYTNSIKQFKYVFIEKKFEFITLAIIFSMAVVFGSTVLFIYEGAGINPNIHTYFDAVYWSVITISTVGFGDISPVTVEGRVATLFLVVGGMGVIAFVTSIVTTSLSQKIVVLKEEKVRNEAGSLKDFVIICGFGQMGKVLADEFVKVGQKFIIIDQNEDTFTHSDAKNFIAIKADATDSTILKNSGVNTGATSLLAITNSDATNLAIILTARSINPNIEIIARTNNSNAKEKLLLAGATTVIQENEIIALVSAEYIGQPVAFKAIDDIFLNYEGAVMDEIEILGNSHYIGSYLQELDVDIYNLTLIGIVNYNDRQNLIFNPKQDEYILQAKDILIVIGYKESIIEFKISTLSKRGKNG